MASQPHPPSQAARGCCSHLACVFCPPGSSTQGQALRGPGGWLLRVAAAQRGEAAVFHLLPPEQGRRGMESEHSHPALSPCSLQLPGEKPLSLQLCPSLGSLFPNGAPSHGGLSTPASLCCKPCGPQAVNAAAASPPSRSLLPACRIFAWVGDTSHRGLGWGFRYLFPSAEPAVGVFGGEGGCWLACGKMKLLVSLLELPQSRRKAPGKSPDQLMT